MKKIFLIFLLFLSISLSVFAQESGQRLDDINKQIKDLEQKLQETKEREKTLSSQIVYMDNQIKLTTLKISGTENKIDQLEDEIASLSAKIDRLEESLGFLSSILLDRINQTYKNGNVEIFHLLFSSKGFSDFLTKIKYIRIAQLHDKKLMVQMQITKDAYSDQKQAREVKKKEQENLRLQLKNQQVVLAQQKKDKEALLEVTRNDEKRYQELLAASRAEANAIEQAMQQSLALLKNGTAVEEGTQIALMGNSGYPYCSSGPHLHFEVRRNDNPNDPASFLKNISLKYEDGNVGRINSTGDWNWPLSEPTITQEYGMSYWARLGWYNGGPHTGIDMISSSNVIKAPKKGILYKGSTSCRGAGMNFVAIDHGDGLISWYWHVQ